MFYSIGSIRAGILFFGSFVLLLLFLTACGTGNSDSEASEYALNRNDSGMSGEIEIDGSSTVYPISEAVAEEFNKLYPNVRVNVGVSGTGGGFKRFTAGETDISDASRPMKNPGETSKAVENGIRYAELRLGTDGISVMVNLENTFVDCLTTEELRKIWEPGSRSWIRRGTWCLRTTPGSRCRRRRCRLLSRVRRRSSRWCSTPNRRVAW